MREEIRWWRLQAASNEYTFGDSLHASTIDDERITDFVFCELGEHGEEAIDLVSGQAHGAALERRKGAGRVGPSGSIAGGRGKPSVNQCDDPDGRQNGEEILRHSSTNDASLASG